MGCFPSKNNEEEKYDNEKHRSQNQKFKKPFANIDNNKEVSKNSDDENSKTAETIPAKMKGNQLNNVRNQLSNIVKNETLKSKTDPTNSKKKLNNEELIKEIENFQEKNQKLEKKIESLKKDIQKEKKEKIEIDEKRNSLQMEVYELKEKLSKYKNNKQIDGEFCQQSEASIKKMNANYSHLLEENIDLRKKLGLEDKTLPSRFKSLSYDLTININSFQHDKFLWKVEKDKNLKKIDKTKEISIIGFLGSENTGKTYILNKLYENSPFTSETKGIGLKYSKNMKFLYIDPKGFRSPVSYYDKELLERYFISKDELDEETKENMRKERIITELFIKDFIFEVSNVIIYVVGVLNQNEQEEIEKIIFKSNKKKKIIIIHNFPNIFNEIDLEIKLENDIKRSFGIEEKDLVLEDFMESDKNIFHLVLVADFSEFGTNYNQKKFDYLKKMLENVNEKQIFDVFEELKSFIKEKYKQYFDKKFTKKSSIKYDENNEFIKFTKD